VFDAVALRSANLGSSLSKISKCGLPFKQTVVPETIYEHAAEKLKDYVDLFANVEDEPSFANYFEDNDFTQEVGKSAQLANFSLPNKSKIIDITRTNGGPVESMARAIFYLEVSRNVTAPLLLNPDKSEFLISLGTELRKRVDELIQKIVDERFQKQLEGLMGSPPPILELPPLSSHIIKRAIDSGTSPLDCALQLRDTPEAQSYRGFLHELNQDLNRGRPGLVRAKKKMEEIKNWAETCLSANDFTLDVSCKQLECHVSELAVFGWIFKVLGVNSVKLKFPSLFTCYDYGEPYKAFIASWYR
jgi:hypothetical protein